MTSIQMGAVIDKRIIQLTTTQNELIITFDGLQNFIC